MKTITFEGRQYETESPIRYIARDGDGSVHGYMREPEWFDSELGPGYWMPDAGDDSWDVTPIQPDAQDSLLDLGDQTPDPTDDQLYGRTIR